MKEDKENKPKISFERDEEYIKRKKEEVRKDRVKARWIDALNDLLGFFFR